MRIVIREQFHLGGYGIWLFEDRIAAGQKVKMVAKPIKLELEECRGYSLPEPTLTFDGEKLEQMISTGAMEFEVSGLGKQLGMTHSKEMSAVQKHLEDMRKLVFK